MPALDYVQCGIMSKKPGASSYRSAKLFLTILFVSLLVTLCLVYMTSSKIVYLAFLHSKIRSSLLNNFNGSQLILNNTSIIGTVRPDSCVACFSHNFNYVINNDEMCKLYNDSQEIDIVIFIFTTHQHRKERNAIRQTWLNYANKNKANIRYSFVLGEVHDENLKILVAEENKLHKDILKEDFVDTYQNLTYKTMMAFKYAIIKCSHAKFVLKTDDDMWINIPRLLKIVQLENTTLQTAVGGSCHHVAEPIRNTASKWYASFQSYPHASYPGYCSGTGYVTSINVARKVFDISNNVPFFHLEDVYVAICIRNLGYKLHPIPGFNAYRPAFDPCLYKGDKLVSSHGVPSDMLISVWNTPCIS